MIAHLDRAGLSAVHHSAASVDNEGVGRVGPRRGQRLAELLQTRSGRPFGCMLCYVGLFHSYSLDDSLPIDKRKTMSPMIQFQKLGRLC